MINSKNLALTAAVSFLLVFNSFAQSNNFEDGFEDGDFTDNPTWSGDSSLFKVIDDAPNYLLRLDGNDGSGSPAYLSTTSSDVEGTWTFYIKLDFAPSGSNQAEVFLMSDTDDLTDGTVTGYAVQVGESSDDYFRLVRYDSGSEASNDVITGTTVVESGEGYTVRVNRDSNGNWDMDVSNNYGGPYTTTNSGSDNTYSSASHFGVRTKYTSTRSDKFYFDFKIDLPPFDVTQASISNGQVDISFNRGYDQSTVQTSDFDIDNGMGQPNSVSFPNANMVRLDYGNTNFPSSEYTVSVDNIDDQNGETIAANSTTSFAVFGNYSPGDVIINEFMYDPPAGQEDYVELKNTSSKILDLKDWELGDELGTKVISSSALTLRPDSFLVISKDTSSLYSVYGHREYAKMSSIATFNLTGDDVQLAADDGTKVDSLTYTPGWGGGGVSLERRSDIGPTSLQDNWSNSPNMLNGTPGLSNEVDTDNTPPFVDELFAADENTIQIIFSEPVTPSSAGDIGNYQVSPSRNTQKELDIQMATTEQDSAKLLLGTSLSDGKTYQVTASNISDLFGNPLSGVTQDLNFVKIHEAQPGEIVINEILYKPGDQGSADFVEIYNTTNKNFDLSNWTIRDASGSASIPEGNKLKGKDNLVLTGSSAFNNATPNAIALSGFPSYNNYNGDIVEISNANGRSIDSLRYSTTWGGSTEGTSIERKDPKAASNDASNWQSSTAEKGFSAGTKNPSFQEDTKPPKAVFSKVLGNGNIEVQFNEFIKRTSNLSFSSEGQSLQITSFDSVDANIVVLSDNPSKSTSGSGQSITIKNLSDIKGNTQNRSSIAVSQPLYANRDDIVINEIMYNPLSESDDNQPDQSEYIELRNAGSSAVSLEGLTLHDEPDENGSVSNLEPVNTTAKWVPAGGQVLIYADEAPTFAKSKTANFFDISDPSQRSLMRIDRSTLSLASSDDAIYIADDNGTTVDSVFYDKSWQNPNLIDTRGIALERISPEGPSSNKSNWGSNVNPKGGTPNKENSIFQPKSNPPEESGISFTPNPFTPDGDGKDDNLFINYKLQENDYLIKVRIYDRYGRLVKKLADGKQAGFTGQLIWDGRKDDNSRNRIGIYIVVFEAHNSANGDDKAFKKPVVLARQLN